MAAAVVQTKPIPAANAIVATTTTATALELRGSPSQEVEAAEMAPVSLRAAANNQSNLCFKSRSARTRKREPNCVTQSRRITTVTPVTAPRPAIALGAANNLDASGEPRSWRTQRQLPFQVAEPFAVRARTPQRAQTSSRQFQQQQAQQHKQQHGLPLRSHPPTGTPTKLDRGGVELRVTSTFAACSSRRANTFSRRARVGCELVQRPQWKSSTSVLEASGASVVPATSVKRAIVAKSKGNDCCELSHHREGPHVNAAPNARYAHHNLLLVASANEAALKSSAQQQRQARETFDVDKLKPRGTQTPAPRPAIKSQDPRVGASARVTNARLRQGALFARRQLHLSPKPVGATLAPGVSPSATTGTATSKLPIRKSEIQRSLVTNATNRTRNSALDKGARVQRSRGAAERDASLAIAVGAVGELAALRDHTPSGSSLSLVALVKRARQHGSSASSSASSCSSACATEQLQHRQLQQQHALKHLVHCRRRRWSSLESSGGERKQSASSSESSILSASSLHELNSICAEGNLRQANLHPMSRAEPPPGPDGDKHDASILHANKGDALQRRTLATNTTTATNCIVGAQNISECAKLVNHNEDNNNSRQQPQAQTLITLNDNNSTATLIVRDIENPLEPPVSSSNNEPQATRESGRKSPLVERDHSHQHHNRDQISSLGQDQPWHLPSRSPTQTQQQQQQQFIRPSEIQPSILSTSSCCTLQPISIDTRSGCSNTRECEGVKEDNDKRRRLRRASITSAVSAPNELISACKAIVSDTAREPLALGAVDREDYHQNLARERQSEIEAPNCNNEDDIQAPIIDSVSILRNGKIDCSATFYENSSSLIGYRLEPMVGPAPVDESEPAWTDCAQKAVHRIFSIQKQHSPQPQPLEKSTNPTVASDGCVESHSGKQTDYVDMISSNFIDNEQRVEMIGHENRNKTTTDTTNNNNHNNISFNSENHRKLEDYDNHEPETRVVKKMISQAPSSVTTSIEQNNRHNQAVSISDSQSHDASRSIIAQSISKSHPLGLRQDENIGNPPSRIVGDTMEPSKTSPADNNNYEDDTADTLPKAKRKVSRQELCNIISSTPSIASYDIPIKSEPISDFYDIETRPFARGKFAQVKRCTMLGTKECFAAKCIKKRRRLVDIKHEISLEIEALKLSCMTKHIVRLYEVFETPNEMILILEMAKGGELQRVIDDEESIDELVVRRMIKQILEGLIHLHDNQIAHLDIKPQNLLLTEPYPDGDIKLCDFGISRRITKDCEIRDICGTPDYVAPEILRYDPISLATDMWSLGVLTYVLLSGYSPFGSENKQQTFCNITQAALDFPSEMFDKISNEAVDFISKLIVREPSGRLTSRQAREHYWIRQC